MKFVQALANLFLGFMLGLGGLEITLQLNPQLLWRGMALPAPADESLTIQDYFVWSTDADLFYWIADQIRPISPQDNHLEAHVHFETDELGFPNHGPLPAVADIIILGRSYSMGAQSSAPWVKQLSRDTDMRVINLSQPGLSMDFKRRYLRNFGLPRKPRWVIVEVLPSMDILGYHPTSQWLIQRTGYTVLQKVGQSLPALDQHPRQLSKLYPLTIQIRGKSHMAGFFPLYLEALTVDYETLVASQDWNRFREQLLLLADSIRSEEGCMALLFVPTKENLFFSLEDNPEELLPVIDGLRAWKLDGNGNFFQQSNPHLEVKTLSANAWAGREALKILTEEQKWEWIDPSDRMVAALIQGEAVFMDYDTHWNDLGHQLVAQVVIETLKETTCP